MARPTEKAQLLVANDTNFNRLAELLDSFTVVELAAEFDFEDRDRNARDVLAHLHEWHLMMIGWHEVGMSGQKPEIPAPGYTWTTYSKLNWEIRDKYADWTLDATRDALTKTHAQIQELISSHSQDELFEKKHYPWTGTTSLGAYFISSASSHYEWAIKKLKRHKRQLAASAKESGQ